MSGTIAGGLKVRAINLARNPNYYKDIGRIGGKRSKGGGFTNPKIAQSAGRKGSRARWAKYRAAKAAGELSK